MQPPALAAPDEQRALNDQWRALRRSATVVAVLCAPAVFLRLWQVQDMSFGWALVASALAVFAFRGLLDLIFWRFIPQPSMFTLDWYLPDADSVVDFLPPSPGVDQADPRYHRAIYLPRSALAGELGTPLGRTVPSVRGGISPEILSRDEVNRVLGMLAGHTFHYAYQQAPDSSALLQLTPIEP